MNTNSWIHRGAALAIASMMAGCATWHSMDSSEKGTAAAATGGALIGGAVGGPIGAAVGAGAGGYVGHHQGWPLIDNESDQATASTASKSSQTTANVNHREATNTASASTRPYMNDDNVSGNAIGDNAISASDRQNHELIRSVQQALNEKGYDAGAVDGLWGPNTKAALERFQQAQGIPQSSGLGDRTLTALGVSSMSTASTGNDNNTTTGGRASANNTSTASTATTNDSVDTNGATNRASSAK
jgi:peptidoglycan hydrolase-like protein with peptidoglycan-binding domain